MARKFNGNIEVKNNATVDNVLTLTAEATSRASFINSSGQVKSSAVTDIELGYLSGVTSAIQTQLNAKLDDFASTTDNALIRTNGTSGDSLQDSGIIVDDADNITGVNNLTLDGNLTVNGTTTSVNSTNLEVVDANIILNNGGTQASANSQDAGITIEMSDATDAALGYDSTAASRFKIGEVGSLVEIADISTTQTLSNKNIDGTAATGTNAVTTDADQVTLEYADVSKLNIQTASDNVELAIIDLDAAIGDLSFSPINYTPVVATTSAGHLEGIDNYLSTVKDELVKVSANDTTGGYLEDKIVAGSTKVSITTLNDGANEDLQLDVVETNINHDNLLNFVANEHIDHSTVDIATGIDSGLTGGGDITTTRNLSVDISGTTAETVADDADSLLIYDSSATALRSQTRSNFLSGLAKSSIGDISETSFSGAQSATNANVTGFAFSNAEVRSFNAHVSVSVDATSDLFEEFDIQGIQKAADWEITAQSVGDDSLVSFNITSTGQITYSSGSYAGFTSLTIKFRAITTSV